MTLNEAIALAKEGKSTGWGTIITSTYAEKRFITSKYLIASLAPVLRKSYVKALSSIKLLNNPDIFSSWLGIIIASISAEELPKKNRVSFKERDVYKNETWHEDVLAAVNSMPSEANFSYKEAQDITSRIIKKWTTEERMCIIYRYVENFSVKEISRALRTTETAIITILNSAIKKAENINNELAKSNNKIDVFANPIQLFVFALNAEFSQMPEKPIPPEMISGIIEDTADIVAKSFFETAPKPAKAQTTEKAEKKIIKKEETEKNNSIENPDRLDDNDDSAEEKASKGIINAAFIKENKKVIIIIAVIVALAIVLTVFFLNKGNDSDTPDESSSSSTSTTEPTSEMDLTEESSSEESTEEESSSDDNSVAEPVANQTPNYVTQNNNQSNNQNNSSTSQNNSKPTNSQSSTAKPNNNNNNSNNSSSNNNSNSNTQKPDKPATSGSTSAPIVTEPENPVEDDPIEEPIEEPNEPEIPDISEPEEEMPDIQ